MVALTKRAVLKDGLRDVTAESVSSLMVCATCLHGMLEGYRGEATSVCWYPLTISGNHDPQDTCDNWEMG